jgi:hypothetical protein
LEQPFEPLAAQLAQGMSELIGSDQALFEQGAPERSHGIGEQVTLHGSFEPRAPRGSHTQRPRRAHDLPESGAQRCLDVTDEALAQLHPVQCLVRLQDLETTADAFAVQAAKQISQRRLFETRRQQHEERLAGAV